jgi:hypothetical protein
MKTVFKIGEWVIIGVVSFMAGALAQASHDAPGLVLSRVTLVRCVLGLELAADVVEELGRRERGRVCEPVSMRNARNFR